MSRRRIIISCGSKLEPETISASERMLVAPTRYELVAYDRLVKEVKEGHGLTLGERNLVNVFRLFAISGGHDIQAAKINWASGTGALDADDHAEGGPDFVKYRGTKSPGSGDGSHVFPQTIWQSALQGSGAAGYYAYTDDGTGMWGGQQTNGQGNIRINRTATAASVLYNWSSGEAATIAQPQAPWVLGGKRNAGVQSLWANGTKLDESGGHGSSGLLNTQGLGINAVTLNDGTISNGNENIITCSFYGVFDMDFGVIKTAVDNYIARHPL